VIGVTGLEGWTNSALAELLLDERFSGTQPTYAAKFEIARRLHRLNALDGKECPDAQPEQATAAPTVSTDEHKLQVRAEALRAAMHGLPMSGAKDIIERAIAFENFLNGKSD
jgi:hypothetical protein